MAEQVLAELLDELKNHGTFGSLRASLDWQWAMSADEHALFDKERESTTNLEALSLHLQSEKQNMMTQLTFWDRKNELLTANFHDQNLMSGLALTWTRAWETARRKQHELILERTENELHDAIEDMTDVKTTEEGRSHKEIQRYIGVGHEALKKELDHWTDVYDSEMMQREMDIARLRSALEQQQEEHEQLRVETKNRQEIKRTALEMRAKHEQKQRVLTNVVAIQAWWRGVAVRKRLNANGGKGRKGKKGKGKKK